MSDERVSVTFTCPAPLLARLDADAERRYSTRTAQLVAMLLERYPDAARSDEELARAFVQAHTK